jgi:hypothetical protein
MRRLNLLLALVFALTCSAAVFGQGQTFENEKLEYSIELPSTAWRVVSAPDGTNQNVEFVNGDRSDGFLRIRKETVDAGSTAADLLRLDRDQRLRYQPGFVEGKQESFAGRLNGVTFSYEYTNGGKPMAGRIYYLQGDSRTIYTLRFTGAKDKLGRIRSQTDIIARSLKLN